MSRPPVPRETAGGAAARRAGYSLVSTLMAVVLLAIGVLSLAGASASTVSFQTMAQNRTHAIGIARSHLEALRMQDPWSVVSEAAVVVNAEGIPAANGGFARSVTVTVVRTNLVEVRVSVAFPQGDAPVVLSTGIFRGAQVQ
jgi:type IV pilus assembly protein PilV